MSRAVFSVLVNLPFLGMTLTFVHTHTHTNALAETMKKFDMVSLLQGAFSERFFDHLCTGDGLLLVHSTYKP